MNVPARWLADGYWTGTYDRWRARFDLLMVLPEPNGLVRVCVAELARRWRWTPRRVRRLVEGLVGEGYLIHQRRLSRGVVYTLSPELTGGPNPDISVEEIQAGWDVSAEESTEAVDGEAVENEGPENPNIGLDDEEDDDEGDGGGGSEEGGSGGGPAEPDSTPSGGLFGAALPPRPEPEFRPPRQSIPRPRARSSPTKPLLRLTPSERQAASEVMAKKPLLFDQMLEVWREFQQVRQTCLESLEREANPCRLTDRRAFRIIDVLSSVGQETVLEAVANLPYSHWHCGTGRHEREGTKLFPETVFKAQQVQILSEIPDRVPVWELLPPRSEKGVQTRLDFDEQNETNILGSRHVVVAGPVYASRL